VRTIAYDIGIVEQKRAVLRVVPDLVRDGSAICLIRTHCSRLR